MNGKSKVIIVVNTDGFFMSHRLALGKALLLRHEKVIIATVVTKFADKIKKEGFHLIDIEVQRKFGVLKAIAQIHLLYKLFKLEKPDYVHNISLKMSFLSMVACHLTRVPRTISLIAGLGFLYTSRSLFVRVVNKLAIGAFRLLFSGKKNHVIVQNHRDFSFVKKYMCHPKKVHLIRGSGVNPKVFSFTEEVEKGKVVATLVSRLIEEKGIFQFIKAAEIAHKNNDPIEFLLYGAPSPGNPSSISLSQLSEWNALGAVKYKGFGEDMPTIWQETNIAVLPTYYAEGLPKALLEAASTGRAIVTTLHPGCDEIVEDGVNGILISKKNALELYEAIKKLALDKELRRKMGRKGREIVEEHFTDEMIISQTLSIYDSLE